MADDAAQLIGYFQYQLSVRGLYGGPVDGQGNPQLGQALSSLKAALGLEANAKINQELFAAYLNADFARLQADQAKPPAQGGTAGPEPLALAIAAANGASKFKRGELVNLVVTPSRDAHVVCYLRDEDQKVQRFFPNRFRKSALVSAAEPLQLPGRMRFQITASDKGMAETVACFASPREVLSALPPPLNGSDFESLPGATLDTLQHAYAQAAGPALGITRFTIKVD